MLRSATYWTSGRWDSSVTSGAASFFKSSSRRASDGRPSRCAMMTLTAASTTALLACCSRDATREHSASVFSPASTSCFAKHSSRYTCTYDTWCCCGDGQQRAPTLPNEYNGPGHCQTRIHGTYAAVPGRGSQWLQCKSCAYSPVDIGRTMAWCCTGHRLVAGVNERDSGARVPWERPACRDVAAAGANNMHDDHACVLHGRTRHAGPAQ